MEDHVEDTERDTELEPVQPVANIQSIEELKTVVQHLRKKVKALSIKCHLYEKKLKRNSGKLETIFNKDQLQYLENMKCRGSSWSDDTIEKSLKLYLACGPTGYDELKRQKLPYPSRRTLQYRLAKLKFNPDIFDGHQYSKHSLANLKFKSDNILNEHRYSKPS